MADRRKDLSEELPRNQDQQARDKAGVQANGGSGPEGYGLAQEQQLRQGRQDGDLSGRYSDEGLSRGERFDEQQGGGRADDAVTITAADLGRDRAANDDDSETEIDER